MGPYTVAGYPITQGEMKLLCAQFDKWQGNLVEVERVQLDWTQPTPRFIGLTEPIQTHLTKADAVALCATHPAFTAGNLAEKLAGTQLRLLPVARTNPMVDAVINAVRSSLSGDPRCIGQVIPCPFRPGTKRWQRWQLLKGCNTVGEYLAAGGQTTDISKWARAKYLTLTMPDGSPAPISYNRATQAALDDDETNNHEPD